jgi:CRP/FNR family cyclic AMP-dependent transcriptional regulator
MAAETHYQIVCMSPLGVELTEDECRALADVTSIRRLADGEVLIEEGRIDNALHVIISGRLEVVRRTGGDDYVTLHVLREGDFAGEMGFIDGTEHSATLRAMGDTEVYSLTRDGLESLIDTHPRTVYQAMRAIIRQVHAILLRMNQQYVEMNNYISKQHGRY